MFFRIHCITVTFPLKTLSNLKPNTRIQPIKYRVKKAIRRTQYKANRMTIIITTTANI